MHDATDRRLDRLELEVHALRRSHARWRRATFAMCGLAAIGTLAGLTADDVFDVLRARRVELVDADGKVAALIGANEQGGQLDLWAKGGANVCRLAAAESGGDLSLWNTAGKPVAGVYANSGGGRVEVSRGDGELAAYFEATPDGSDLAMSRAGSENAAARFRVNKDRSEALLARAEDHSVLLFGVTGKGSAVTILGDDDREIAYLGSDQNRAGMLRLAKNGGASMLEAGVGDHGGELIARNLNGQGGTVLGNGDKGGFAEVRNVDGKSAASLAVQDNSGGRVAAYTATGQLAAFMDQGKDENGTVQVYAGPNRMAALGGSPTGGLLNLFNMQGKAVFVAGSAADGKGGLFSIRTGDGAQVVRASAEPAPEIAVYSEDGQQKRVITAPAKP
jgi:hypothetical protein